MKQQTDVRTLSLTLEEKTDLVSILTYCKLNNPSSALKKSAKQLLQRMYQEGLFDINNAVIAYPA